MTDRVGHTAVVERIGYEWFGDDVLELSRGVGKSRVPAGRSDFDSPVDVRVHGELKLRIVCQPNEDLVVFVDADVGRVLGVKFELAVVSRILDVLISVSHFVAIRAAASG